LDYSWKIVFGLPVKFIPEHGKNPSIVGNTEGILFIRFQKTNYVCDNQSQ